MKNIFIILATLVSSVFANAQDTRLAITHLNRTYNPGESLNVRRLLNDLHPNDFVISLQVRAAAHQPGSYLQLIIDDKLVRNVGVGPTLQVINISMMKRNGVDYRKLALRTVGPIYFEFLAAMIDNNNGYQPNPNPYDPNPYPQPQPQPDPYDPQPQPGYPSLSGYCDDYDHSQFYAAKEFAYSSTGLNMTAPNATNWALSYNQSHACGTISEFQNRFSILREFAYSSTGLNMTAPNAREYALSKVEHMTVEQIQIMTNSMSEMKEFAYSSTGLNLTSVNAAWLARSWGERGYCEAGYAFASLRNQFQNDYSFAYSSSGLNMTAPNARRYAVDRLQSRCTDLIRQVVP